MLFQSAKLLIIRKVRVFRNEQIAYSEALGAPTLLLQKTVRVHLRNYRQTQLLKCRS